MATIDVFEAQARLPELIHRVDPGAEGVRTENSTPVAKLVAAPASKPAAILGRCTGMVVIETEDEEHLEYFEDYMP